jgi:hypothetical protein
VDRLSKVSISNDHAKIEYYEIMKQVAHSNDLMKVLTSG